MDESYAGITGTTNPRSGWSTWPEGEGHGWKAYGPRGEESGHCASHDVAMAVAAMAADRLSESPPYLRLVQ